jgi:hypothetical protein
MQEPAEQIHPGPQPEPGRGEGLREAVEGTPDRLGIVAAVLAAAIAVLGLMAGQQYALRLAMRSARAVAAPTLPIKYEHLTFQRAALERGDLLPIYGSSELFCCGAPDIGTQFFAQEPTGFEPFALGRAGTGDLFFGSSSRTPRPGSSARRGSRRATTATFRRRSRPCSSSTHLCRCG